MENKTPILSNNEFNFIKNIPFPISIIEGDAITFRNFAWENLITPEKEVELLNYNTPKNVEIAEKSYISFYSFIPPNQKLVWLYPADFLEAVQEELSELKTELSLKDQRLKILTQNAPLVLLIIDAKTGDILFFSNNQIIDLCEIDLNTFYTTMNLYKLINNSADLRRLLGNIEEGNSISNENIKVILQNRKEKWWSINASRVDFDGLDTIIVAITDITKQKEQERKLEEAYYQIQTQNEELKQAQEELQIANEQLSKAHKSLEDSMKYAKKVQQSILFPIDKIKEVFSNYDIGILFRPHSYVSGDFIWVDEKDDYVYIGVCDATGHGAGGAIMAILGNFALREAFKKLKSPEDLGQMLYDAHILMLEQLNMKKAKMNADGFDAIVMALPKIANKPIIKAYASAAKTPLIVVQNNQFNLYKPETHPIGFVWNHNYNWSYTTETIDMDETTAIYLITDGFISQHGLIETEAGKQELKFGKKRLEQTIMKIYNKPAEEQVRILDKLLDHWKGNLPQTDDITIVVIKRK